MNSRSLHAHPELTTLKRTRWYFHCPPHRKLNFTFSRLCLHKPFVEHGAAPFHKYFRRSAGLQKSLHRYFGKGLDQTSWPEIFPIKKFCPPSQIQCCSERTLEETSEQTLHNIVYWGGGGRETKTQEVRRPRPSQCEVKFPGGLADLGGTRRNLTELGGTRQNSADVGGSRRNSAKLGYHAAVFE